MAYPEPIKGAGQALKTFEKDIDYISDSDVEPDSDGYVRGDRTLEYTLKGAVVPMDEETLSNLEYGDDVEGMTYVYIRTQEQPLEEEIEIEVGGYFRIDGNEWKILNINNYGTVIVCECGLSSEGGYKIGGS